MLSLLEADSIPAFVHGGAIGALLPGPQINSYNTRRIMVPSELAERAQATLAVLSAPSAPPAPPVSWSFRERLRVVLEFLFLGWFIPSRDSRSLPHAQSEHGGSAT